MTEPGDPREVYTAAQAVAAAEVAATERRWNRLANARLAAALLALLALGWLIARQELVALMALLLAVGSFIGLVAWHYRVGQRRTRAQAALQQTVAGQARLARDWANLPLPPPYPNPPPLAHDLDLLGSASLEHLLSTVTTPVGHACLAARLLDPPRNPRQIAARQEAVRELRAQIGWCRTLELEGRVGTLDRASYERLAAWGGQAGPNAIWPWLPPLALGLALFTLLGFAAQALSLTSLPLGWIGVIANTLVTIATGLRAEGVISRAELGRAAIERYSTLLRHASQPTWQSDLLRTLHGQLGTGAAAADRRLAHLARLLAFGELRRSPIYLALQLGLLWNIHLAWRLEAWRLAHGAEVAGWLDVLGELETLAALAVLAHDQPTWIWPTIRADAPAQLAAQQLGHPLLPDAQRVGNDLQIGPPGTLLLITGSNMAGKSTLLRAVGLNWQLACAGGPVCAEAMVAPPLRLAAVIRVEDSLRAGVSYFMAELQRLRAVVDAARHAQQDGEPLLYLLDEILHGTNSAERQIAARRVLRHLIDLGAIGAVSTHDLELGEGAEVRAAAQQVHLREQIDPIHGTMFFDYRLREGRAPTSNALRLLALVGLDRETP